MLSKKLLIKAVNEFNEVMGLNPPLDSDPSSTILELTDRIKSAIPYIDPINDEFTADTRHVIEEFTNTMPKPNDKEEEFEGVIEISEENGEATAEYVDQAKDEPPVEIFKSTPKQKTKTTKIHKSVTYYEVSDVVKGLTIGSIVTFTTAANSRKAPATQLTGEVKQIKIDLNKTANEVVHIKTDVGMFFKYSKAVELVK